MRRGLRIGQVARAAEVNVETLRYYERRGILAEPERSASGYREYPAGAIRVVRFVKRAQELGFSLREVAELLALRERRPRDRRAARELAAAKVRDIEGKLRDLTSMRKALGALVETCACKGANPDCPILEALEGDPRPEARRSP